jgi:integrase
MGALRVDLSGEQDSFRGADRDHAFISLCLATGIRRNNLTHITTYEVPPVSELALTTMQVADLITKNDAGGDAITFSHRLPAVHGYIDGPRAEDATRRPFRPRAPLHLVKADQRELYYCDPNSDEPDRVRRRRWSDADDRLRARLVNPDGTSPILFLNSLTGAPLSYSAHQHVVADAARFVRERINPEFPAGFRIHDLRHTYAVHLTVAIYRNVLADAVNHGANPTDAWVIDHIGAAVDLVKYSLGHASDASTRLYTQTAHRFLGIPLEQFLGQS